MKSNKLLSRSAHHVNTKANINRRIGKNSKKNQGIKVVYISNPMKVKTSASQFRALVQELTGQDSELPADPARFLAEYYSSSSLANSTAEICHRDALDLEVASPTHEKHPAESSNSNTQYHELVYGSDDLFTPGMIDNFAALLPSSVLYG